MLSYVALSLASDAATITQAIALTAACAGCMKPEVDASDLQQPLTRLLGTAADRSGAFGKYEKT